MRRKPDEKAPNLGRFEIQIRAPTLGLVTRVPGDQPDPRAATVASNVRFDDGVIRNAPGCSPVILPSPLDTTATLIFQANIAPANGVVSSLGSILIATSRRIYHLTGMTEAEFSLLTEQVIEFLGDVRSHDQLRLVPMATRLSPRVFVVSIGDDCELWKLRARDPSEIDDGNGFIVPIDYGVQTNNVILARIR